MPVVREDMDLPAGSPPLAQVDVQLAGADCRPRYGFTGTFTTILGTKTLKPGAGINAVGYWELNLVGNNDIDPLGTTYRITRRLSDRSRVETCIFVPVTGGPYNVSDLTIEPLDPLPLGGTTTEVDYVERATNFGPVQASPNGFALLPVDDMVVEVPDVLRPCYVETQVSVSVTGGPAVFIAGIGAPGVVEQLGPNLDQVREANAADVGTQIIIDNLQVIHRVPAGSPGQYQLYIGAHANDGLFSSTPLAVTLQAATYRKARMSVQMM